MKTICLMLMMWTTIALATPAPVYKESTQKLHFCVGEWVSSRNWSVYMRLDSDGKYSEYNNDGKLQWSGTWRTTDNPKIITIRYHIIDLATGRKSNWCECISVLTKDKVMTCCECMYHKRS